MGRRAAGEAGLWARNVARALEQLIDDRGLTKQDVAEKAGIGLSYFYARMRGDLSFTLNDVEKLAAVLGVHPAVLLMLAVKDDNQAAAAESSVSVDRGLLAERLRSLIAAPLPDGSTFEWQRIATPAAVVGLSESDFSDLQSGVGADLIPATWLRVIAEQWGVDERYLTLIDDDQVVEATLANLDLRTALRETGTDALFTRTLGEASPSAVRAITAVIRSTSRH